MTLRWEDGAHFPKPRNQIVLDTFLLLLLTGSYIPQIQLIQDRCSTAGITQTYVMFTYLFTTSQFTLILLAFGFMRPIIESIKDKRLRGLDAYGAIVSLLQMTVAWIGSSFLLLAYVSNSSLPRTTHIFDTLTADLTAPESNVSRWLRWPKTIVFICTLHTFVFLLPAIAIFIWHPMHLHPQSPIRGRFGPFNPICLFCGFSGFYLIPACLMLVTFIFPLQIIESAVSSVRTPTSSLSIKTLTMQTIAFPSIAWSWRRSLNRHRDYFSTEPEDVVKSSPLYNTDLSSSYRRWGWLGLREKLKSSYRGGDWLWVNNLIFGIGQGVLLLIHLWNL